MCTLLTHTYTSSSKRKRRLFRIKNIYQRTSDDFKNFIAGTGIKLIKCVKRNVYIRQRDQMCKRDVFIRSVDQMCEKKRMYSLKSLSKRPADDLKKAVAGRRGTRSRYVKYVKRDVWVGKRTH